MPKDERAERPRNKPVRRNKPKKPEDTKVPAFDPTTGPALRGLRALGHGLDPVLSLGKDGLTDGVVDACKAVLLRHELVKVKVLREAPVDRKEVAVELATKTGATLVQVLGRTFLLYKRHPTKPKLRLPKASKPDAASGKSAGRAAPVSAAPAGDTSEPDLGED